MQRLIDCNKNLTDSFDSCRILTKIAISIKTTPIYVPYVGHNQNPNSCEGASRQKHQRYSHAIIRRLAFWAHS